MLVILSLLGIAAGIAGSIIKTVGQVEQAKSQAQDDLLKAKADALKAANLEELSKGGGYYDQVLAALETELADTEADRLAASTSLALTEAELSGALEQSKLSETAAVAGLQGKIKESAIQEKVSVAQQVVGGLETAQAGAQATGQIGARAGAGNIAGGSVLRQAESVMRQVSRRVSLANLGISGTKEIGKIERQGLTTEIGVVQGAADVEQLRIQNDITRSRLNYEDTLRGLNTRQAGLIAEQTKTTFQQTTGLEEAGLLTEEAANLTAEADWLTTYGVPLTIAGGVVSGIATAASQVSDLGDILSDLKDNQ